METESLARRISEEFKLNDTVSSVRPYGNGLINDTYRVETANGLRVILQRLNSQVFPQPELILANLRTLLEHARSQDIAGLRLPALYPTHDGRDFAVDDTGGLWRALEFIADSHSLSKLSNVVQAQETGSVLGRFHVLLHELPVEQLHTTLPGFHVTPDYLRRFDAVLHDSQVSYSVAVRNALAFVEARRDFCTVLEDARVAGDLHRRPTHGDPKLDNFLFNTEATQIVAVIDLDTVQPGLLQVDVADCLRSSCNRLGETPADPHAVRFDLPLARAILRGYLSEARALYTDTDLEYLVEAICLIPFELGLRFLADHFAGDTYFKVTQPGQNLVRAQAQFRLTEDIERQEKDLRALILT